jgi:WD40 repeat protein
MLRVELRIFGAGLTCLVALATIVPNPLRAQPVISTANAGQVRSVAEFPIHAYRIRRGPGPGELTIFDFNGPVEVVDDQRFASLRKLAEGAKGVDFAATGDGRYSAWQERGKTAYKLQDASSGKVIEIEVGASAGNAAFSPDGKLLAIGNTAWDPMVEGAGFSEMRLYDLSGKLVRTLEKSGAGGLTPVFSASGKLLAVGNRNHQTRIFEVETGKLLHTLDRKMTQEIAFSPDDKLLAAGYVDGMVMLWDMDTGQPRRATVSGCDEIYSVDWSPAGDVLATSGRRGNIVLWDKELGKLKELGAPLWVIQARFTADGKGLLTSSAADLTAKTDRKITVWSVPQAK